MRSTLLLLFLLITLSASGQSRKGSVYLAGDSHLAAIREFQTFALASNPGFT